MTDGDEQTAGLTPDEERVLDKLLLRDHWADALEPKLRAWLIGTYRRYLASGCDNAELLQGMNDLTAFMREVLLDWERFQRGYAEDPHAIPESTEDLDDALRQADAAARLAARLSTGPRKRAVRFEEEEEEYLRYLGSYEAWEEYKHLPAVLSTIFRQAITSGGFTQTVQKHVGRLYRLFDRTIKSAVKDSQGIVADSRRALEEGSFEFPHSESLLRRDLEDQIRTAAAAEWILERWREVHL